MPNNDSITKTFTPEETALWLSNLEKRFASAEILCESPDGKLLVIRSPYKYFWSVPGGLIDGGETPKIAAVRETAEEVGIVLNPDTVEFRMVVDRVLGELGHTYQFIFRASIDDAHIAGIQAQPGEISDYAFVTKEEVRAADSTTGRAYGAAIYDWANDVTGYDEKVFSPR